ncbi:CBS domain-containing protein [Candidatus Bathyarchaeota archaeon]|nr:CBS domain-containing protein [Candidatus Bathyarchaeota archaeon]
MRLQVQDAMIRNVMIVDSDLSVKNAARMMAYLQVSSLVVVENNVVVGIITKGDIISRVVSKDKNPNKLMVSEVMTTPLLTTMPEADLEFAAQLMVFNKIKKLPVLSGYKDSELVGLLSLTDIARFFPLLYAKLFNVDKLIESKNPALLYID